MISDEIALKGPKGTRTGWFGAVRPGIRMWFAAAAGTVMLYLALRVPIIALWNSGLGAFHELAPEWMYYNITVLSANYVDLGFVRRGLGGTLSWLLSRDAYVGGLSLHALSAMLLAIPILLLQLRLLRTVWSGAAILLIAFILISPQTFLAWGHDIARTDMLATAAIMWAVLALVSGRPLVAAMTLVAGSLVHESALIFGFPLLLVLGVIRTSHDPMARRRHVVAFVGLIAGLAAVAILQWMSGPGPAEISAAMHRRTPSPPGEWYADMRDCAIYMMVAGLRGVRTAICYNGYAQGYALLLAVAVGVVGVNAVILGLDRKPMAFVVAVLLPTLFLAVVANDLGRWVKFAAVSTWVLSITQQSAGTLVLDRMRVLLGLIGLGLMLALGGARVHHPNSASAYAARFLGLDASPPVDRWMTYCDAGWREIAGR